MKFENTAYSPIWITNEDGYAYFNGSYIWDKENESFEVSGIESTAFDIPTDRDDTVYIVKKLEDKWQISLKPFDGGSFTPIHTQLTDKIVEFLLNKHEWNHTIIYPHNSHPYK